jgi:alkylation response protein AidB-like acyl-CoA dehydrogenase
MFLDALARNLGAHATSAAIRRVEAGESPAGLWQAIEDAGFLDLMAPQAQGGAGLALPELFPLLECLGRHALPLPVAQAIVVRALVAGREALPPGVLTIATQSQRPGGGLRCPQTPGGMVAGHVLVADGDALLLLACTPASRVAVGDPRNLVAHLQWADPVPVWRLPVGGAQVEAFAVAAIAAQLSGAMQRTFDMALEQCNNRVQFGKPIGKFQALQQQLSVMAQHVLAAAIAAEAAFRSPHGLPTALGGAVAKSRTSEAAAVVAATAHAVHGAIGMTDAFDLGILTRRLHDWRMAYGAEEHWNRLIGAQVLSSEATLADFVRAV